MKRSVLVVDDSSATREWIAGILEDMEEEEIEVVACASGFDALRALPSRTFDLIVTDINMPDVHGLELLAWVRRNPATQGTPVLLISTESSERDIRRGLALGASEYLAKPFPAERFSAAARRLLGAPPAGVSGAP
ncbi:MAG TPA: response regulator [Myxococcales bacterium]|nr:response regulator [Myxococcales bacterium]